MTNTTQAVEQVLKTDMLGRMKTPAARREQLLDEVERSGLSGKKFAALVGIKYPTFATWSQRRRRQRGAYVSEKVPTPARDKVRWLEAVVEQAHHPGGQSQPALVLALPGGARIEIADVKQVALAAALAWICAERSCVRGMSGKVERFFTKFETSWAHARQTVRPMERSFHLSFRTFQRKGHPHPALSGSTPEDFPLGLSPKISQPTELETRPFRFCGTKIWRKNYYAKTEFIVK